VAGQFRSYNVDDGYGIELDLLRDADGDGFPDRRDADPDVPGYAPATGRGP
jgi:hypothetical protein